VGSSRVGAVLERREREQKRSGSEGGGSAMPWVGASRRRRRPLRCSRRPPPPAAARAGVSAEPDRAYCPSLRAPALRVAQRAAAEMTQASLLEEVESCSTSVLSSRAGANRDGRNYVAGASQSVGRRRESPKHR